MKNVTLSIVIVTWNVREQLHDCLRSIERNAPKAEYEVVVIDNNSNDSSDRMVHEGFPNVTLIVNDQNRGFAAANNQGIHRSTGEYVLLLNPDTIVHPGALDALINFMDRNTDVGACGPKLLYSDGRDQPSVRYFNSQERFLFLYGVQVRRPFSMALQKMDDEGF